MDRFVGCPNCQNTFRISGSQDIEEDRTWSVICPHCNAPNEVDFPSSEGVFKVYPS
jgi:hypothetical protein